MDHLDVITVAGLAAAIGILFIVGYLAGPRSGDAESLFRAPTDLGWPRGVQEEEPVRWRVELLGRWRSTPGSYPITTREATAPIARTR